MEITALRSNQHPAGLVLAASLFLGLPSCGGASSPAQGANQAPAQPSAQPASDAPTRPTLTVQDCETSGGSVVGDIGDGAIHRPEYRCANGAKPTGSIRAAEGGPIAIEGSVCCPK